MSHATVCPEHGLVMDADRTDHARMHERARTKRRATLEPWRFVYNTANWRRCLHRVLTRDGHRCRVVEQGERCEETKGLEGHHEPPLRLLWAEHDRGEFVRAATDPAGVVTVCARHNRALDSARRAA